LTTAINAQPRLLAILLIAVVSCAMNPLLSFSAELGELQVTPLPDDGRGAFVVRDPKAAVLVVQTTVHPLSFECNMGIIRVDNPAAGEYRLHLFAGTNLVTFKADGYLPLRERFFLEAKSAIAVRVSALKKGISDEERPEIKLIYQLIPGDARIRGTLDKRILNLDFTNGFILLRPEAGEHQVRLVKAGRIWEKAFQLAAGEKVQETVQFSEGAITEAPEERPGGLYITSTIPSVRVFLNDVYQGLTPLTLDSVQAGAYEMRLERSLFQSQLMNIVVKPLDYAAYEVRLIPNFGVVRIDSDPPGAVVQIDGAERGITPLDPQRMDAGSYRIRMIRSHYAERDSIIEVKSGDSLDLRIPLTPRFGRLVFTSDPVGASVTLDGRKVGNTPLSCDTVASGDHQIIVSLTHYHETEDQVRLADGEDIQRDYQLSPNFGIATITGTPSGAALTLEGEEQLKATLPFEGQKLSPGIYRVTVEQEGYEPLHDVIVIESNRTDSLLVDLKRQTGTLKVSSSPQGATIWLDNLEVGSTPSFLHDVPTGRHSLRLDRQGYDIVEDTLQIDNMELTSFEWTLSAEGTRIWQAKRIAGVVRSAFLPGLGQLSHHRPVRGALWLAAFSGSLALAFDAQRAHQTKQGIYDRELEAYESTDTPSAAVVHYQRTLTVYDQMRDLDRKWKIYLGSAAGIYLLQLADAWFFSAGERPHTSLRTLQLGVTTDGSGGMIGVVFQFGNTASEWRMQR